MKKKEKGFFKELMLAWKNSDSPHMGFGGLGAVAIWFASSIIAYFTKNFFGLSINLFYIFIPVYFILISFERFFPLFAELIFDFVFSDIMYFL